MLDVMDCRRNQLEETLSALSETGMPLVSVSGGQFSPAGFSDDKGVFYFIPMIAKSFGLSIDHSIHIFYIFLLLFGLIVASFAFCLIFKSWYSRLFSIFGLLALVFQITGRLGSADVYVAAVFSVMAIVPVFILLQKKCDGYKKYLAIALAVSGIVIGYSNCIRNNSGTGVFLFLTAWIFLSGNLLKKEKLVSCLLLTVFCLIPYWHFNHLEKQRDDFIKKKNPTYEKALGYPIWHVIFSGFSYLQPNKYGFVYRDLDAFGMAKRVNPNIEYCSDEHYQILKDQTFALIKKDTWFVLQTIITKVGSLLFQLLLYVNIGLAFFFYVRPSRQLLLPFLIGACFYSMAGILAMPFLRYVMGMLSLAAVFGIYMTALGLEKYYKTKEAGSACLKNST